MSRGLPVLLAITWHCIVHCPKGLEKIISLFQSKGHGQHGVIGVHAQGLAIPTLVFAQCFTMVTCLALEPQVKLETVKVRWHVWFLVV